MKSMRQIIKDESDFNLTLLSNENQEENLNKMKEFHLILNIIDQMLSDNNSENGNGNEIRPLKINFYLYYHDNLDRWDELHQEKSIEESIEYLNQGPFPEIIKKLPLGDDFHDQLLKYFEKAIERMTRKNDEFVSKSFNKIMNALDSKKEKIEK